ncbi:MAG: radical SAM protein [Candidatus Tectomicrobia bacterium]|nr:radical SAM protein [Candidatus Tectomicrobia bacterium]
MHSSRTATDSVPGYVRLHESGELRRRAEEALASLERCRVCPWDCDVNRLQDEKRVCRTGRYARVDSCFPHFGEEDCLRGWRGSGTLFFGWCNLCCVFCQNFDISQREAGREARPEELARMMLRLQDCGCHNINFVTPEHVVPQILEALPIAVEGGLRLPIVYNTSAFDSLESLRHMDGVVDIYMPDFKYWSEEKARRYLKSPRYPAAARAAIREMHRQVGELTFDERGLARRGVLLRHLVMPGGLDDTREIMRFLAREVSPDTYVNLMGQYRPAGKVSAERYSEINRPIDPEEVSEAYRIARQAGLHRFDFRRRRLTGFQVAGPELSVFDN